MSPDPLAGLALCAIDLTLCQALCLSVEEKSKAERENPFVDAHD